MEKKTVLKMEEELIKDMNSNLPGELTMSDLQKLSLGKGLRIPFVINDSLVKSDLCNLDLSVRANNALRRAGFNTVGDIVLKLDTLDELKKIRSCGTTTIAEIAGKLYCYQYGLIPKERKAWYMRRVLELNGIRNN